MRGLPTDSQSAVTKRQVNFPAVSTAAVVTISAIPEERHVIKQIDCSYGTAAPTAPTITVTIAGVTVWQQALPAAIDSYQFFFMDGLFNASTVNEEAVVTLSAETGAVGRLVVLFK